MPSHRYEIFQSVLDKIYNWENLDLESYAVWWFLHGILFSIFFPILCSEYAVILLSKKEWSENFFPYFTVSLCLLKNAWTLELEWLRSMIWKLSEWEVYRFISGFSFFGKVSEGTLRIVGKRAGFRRLPVISPPGSFATNQLSWVSWVDIISLQWQINCNLEKNKHLKLNLLRRYLVVFDGLTFRAIKLFYVLYLNVMQVRNGQKNSRLDFM